MLLRHIVSLLSLAVVPTVADTEAYPITGVPVDPRAGGVPLRREISELEAIGGAQWDLYIRALVDMYEKNYTDPLSYFQVAGIHGKPFIEWNGGGSKNTEGWQGYCPHGEKIFLPWHRPYVVLYEQVLVENAKRIALTYPQRYRYQYIRAAETLRSPYWDWAADNHVPPVTVPATLTVNIPQGEILEAVEINNPLATYKFPKEVLDGEYGDFDSQKRSRIFRCQSPKTYPVSANEAVAARPYKRWIYDSFTHAEKFSDFASTRDGGISLEQVHNGIHWDGACGGQFLSSESTAFDPLFWLHHTNVDRLWAYWQAISPEDGIFHDPYTGGARFAVPEGTTITPDSPLHPFFKSEGTLHTTRSVEKIESFGYTYQGLEYWEKSAAQMRQETKKLVNRLYGPETNAASMRLGVKTANATTRYFARVSLDVTEVERPCVVELYVGDKQAGTLVVMQQPATGIMHGGFPLDDALDAAEIQTLRPEYAVHSIISSLEVAIVKADGAHIPIKSVPGLKVEIEDVLFVPSDREDELPTFGTSRRRPAVAMEKGERLLRR